MERKRKPDAAMIAAVVIAVMFAVTLFISYAGMPR